MEEMYRASARRCVFLEKRYDDVPWYCRVSPVSKYIYKFLGKLRQYTYSGEMILRDI